jgi:hypothetical protein
MARPKKKISNSTENSSLSSSDDVPMFELDKTAVNQLLSQVFLRYKNEVSLDKKIKHKEITQLSIMAEEYLSSFVLLGFSLQNEKVVVFNVPTAKDEAAIMDLLRNTMIDIMGGRG